MLLTSSSVLGCFCNRPRSLRARRGSTLSYCVGAATPCSCEPLRFTCQSTWEGPPKARGAKVAAAAPRAPIALRTPTPDRSQRARLPCQADRNASALASETKFTKAKPRAERPPTRIGQYKKSQLPRGWSEGLPSWVPNRHAGCLFLVFARMGAGTTQPCPNPRPTRAAAPRPQTRNKSPNPNQCGRGKDWPPHLSIGAAWLKSARGGDGKGMKGPSANAMGQPSWDTRDHGTTA